MIWPTGFIAWAIAKVSPGGDRLQQPGDHPARNPSVSLRDNNPRLYQTNLL
ncbi:MAG TPA: hypothetical protein V6C46_00030 [Coleofasciculaceae cyanobacterium]